MSEAIESPPAMPFWSRLANIFAAPDDAFAEIKNRPVAHANWLVPLFLSCFVGVMFSVVVFSQNNITHAMREAQEKAMQKQVDAGKMSKQQAEQAAAFMEKFTGPRVMMTIGVVFGTLGSGFFLFLAALIVWIIGKVVFTTPLAFLKAVEITGLASTINVLGGIIKMLLVLVTTNINMSASPALFIEKFDPTNRMHALAAIPDVMMIWYLAVLAIGLVSVTGGSITRACVSLYGIWLAVVLSLLGLGALLGWNH